MVKIQTTGKAIYKHLFNFYLSDSFVDLFQISIFVLSLVKYELYKMEATLNFSANIQLTLSQLVDLARQLPQKERAKLASMIIDSDAESDELIMSKSELKAKIKEGLQDAKLHREGKIKLRTLTEFLADV